MTPRRLIYLHGFRSSPASFKARRVKAWLDTHRPDVAWHCPQLPPSPAEAWRIVHALALAGPTDDLAVAGSSLGGFYVTVLAEAIGCPAVVLNPAVDPARDLAAYIGDQTQFHRPEEHFFFEPRFVDELRALTPRAITRPERYAAVIAKGDELLDWQEMCGRYAGARIRLLEGSDHALSDFDDHLPWVVGQLGLAPATGPAMGQSGR